VPAIGFPAADLLPKGDLPFSLGNRQERKTLQRKFYRTASRAAQLCSRGMRNVYDRTFAEAGNGAHP